MIKLYSFLSLWIRNISCVGILIEPYNYQKSAKSIKFFNFWRTSLVVQELRLCFRSRERGFALWLESWDPTCHAVQTKKNWFLTMMHLLLLSTIVNILTVTNVSFIYFEILNQHTLISQFVMHSNYIWSNYKAVPK